VIMPAYNAEDYIEVAIRSVLDQSYGDFEFIIINDGSEDRTWEIINSFKDGRIRAISQENAGLSATLNKGLRLAAADIIARMDSDDICDKHRFGVQLNILENKPDIVLVGSNIKFIDHKGVAKGYSVSPSSDSSLRRVLKKRNIINHPTVMFRKKQAISVGGYNERVGKFFEDYLLWLSLLNVGRFHVTPEVLLSYRVHDASISSGAPDSVRQIIRRVAREGAISEDLLAKFDLAKCDRPSATAIRYRSGYQLSEPLRKGLILLRDTFRV